MKSGFTLVELVIVMAILFLLGGIFISWKDKMKEKEENGPMPDGYTLVVNEREWVDGVTKFYSYKNSQGVVAEEVKSKNKLEVKAYRNIVRDKIKLATRQAYADEKIKIAKAQARKRARQPSGLQAIRQHFAKRAQRASYRRPVRRAPVRRSYAPVRRAPQQSGFWGAWDDASRNLEQMGKDAWGMV